MLRSSLTRRLLPAAAGLLALSLALTGCGGDDKKDGGSEKRSSGCDYKSGSSSDAVDVSGDVGKVNPKVTFDKPLKADGLQRTIVVKGDGETPADKDSVKVVMSIFNGRTGKTLGSQESRITIGDTTVGKQFSAAIECMPVGSRAVATFAAKDLMGDAGNPEADIKGSDTLVLVGDLVSIIEPPKSKDWANAPTVKFDGRKSPVVTGLPKGSGGSDLLLHVIKKGTGATVQSGDQVTVNYKGINQRTGKTFDESYGKGKAPATFGTDQVVTGFGAALVGQKVGTQLIVSIPPEFGYGASGNAQAGIKGTDTIVFVIEIQATKASAN